MKLSAIPLFIFLFLNGINAFAQVVGKVTDNDNNPLPYVNIYLQGSYLGTTSNDNGNYELNIDGPGQYSIVFQFLGFKTEIKEVNVTDLPLVLNVQMTEESVSLDEVVISTTEDPAYRIIRKTIENRKKNLDRIAEFKADFYSRGLWRVDSIPEKFMGQEVGDFDGQLDSTRTGIIYLSETISKIAYQRPDDFKETIIASKVSGNDNGFSFNTAVDANFSFYENNIDLNRAIVSPIGSNGLSYYRFKLDGVFYEGNKLINKISVIPKRENDRVWKGTIYIVEDDWQLYGIELTTDGEAMQIPFVKELVFKQNFSYDSGRSLWVKRSQTIDFSFGFFGFNGDGKFIAVYSNYDFEPGFDRKSFTNEVLNFLPEANKKDTLFWNGIRPVPLTDEELNDYIKKDSIQQLRKSKPYLDSIDAKNNKFKLTDLLFGYTYENSFRKWNISYEGPLPAVQFNTVQGWNGSVGLRYYKSFDENNTRWLSISTYGSYGISEDRLRPRVNILYNFNRTNRLYVGISAGSTVTQFNSAQPITPLINTVSSLFFERNYMKLYELNYVNARWGQEVFNGFYMDASFGYQDRRQLFNTTDYVTIPNDDVDYTPNDPRQGADPNLDPGLVNHNIMKFRTSAYITFGQKYYSYPDSRFAFDSGKYPRIRLNLETGFNSSIDDYDFTQLSAAVYQYLETGITGDLTYNLKGGTFLGGEDISFVDYQHFNGNQTRIGTSSSYRNVFNLLPYYDLSTNSSYFEGHVEHNFRGWVLGKIPGLNKLNFNLVAGGHVLSTENSKPYFEYSIGLDNLGWGKFRFLRIDYVRSEFRGVTDGAFIFGLKFLDFID